VSDTARTRIQVFIVRVWYEAQEEGERELRIQARHVLTGETRYFLAWPALMAYLSGKQDVIATVPVQQIGRKAISCGPRRGPPVLPPPTTPGGI
jgi:hypothetical protein